MEINIIGDTELIFFLNITDCKSNVLEMKSIGELLCFRQLNEILSNVVD